MGRDIVDSGGDRRGLLKKAISAGLGTLSITEGAVRGMLKEGKMPRQIIGAAVGTVEKAQKEFLTLLAKELGDYLKHLNVAEETKKVLDGMEITVTLRFNRKKGK